MASDCHTCDSSETSGRKQVFRRRLEALGQSEDLADGIKLRPAMLAIGIKSHRL